MNSSHDNLLIARVNDSPTLAEIGWKIAKYPLGGLAVYLAFKAADHSAEFARHLELSDAVKALAEGLGFLLSSASGSFSYFRQLDYQDERKYNIQRLVAEIEKWEPDTLDN